VGSPHGPASYRSECKVALGKLEHMPGALVVKAYCQEHVSSGCTRMHNYSSCINADEELTKWLRNCVGKTYCQHYFQPHPAGINPRHQADMKQRAATEGVDVKTGEPIAAAPAASSASSAPGPKRRGRPSKG
jgi:hypothetical protein